MTTNPRIAIVIGSTRPGRYADNAAGWMLKQTQARDDIEAELLDLRDHPLPFFDEKGPLISTPSENAEALRWQKTLAPYDGFVFVVAEYNQSITGVLKNARRGRRYGCTSGLRGVPPMSAWGTISGL
jgi:NAD(P)H-dependent FMN reductase